MLSSGIKFNPFKFYQTTKNLKTRLEKLINSKSQVLNSLDKSYKFSYDKKRILRFKKNKNFRVIGMGGSILGTQAIHDFLRHKIKKKFIFSDNLQSNLKINQKKKITNLVISKSGNTVETIVNSNILIKKKDKNIFITEDNKNYLYLLAEKLKAEVVHHNNFIGGRYSVLSEVGMLPAELMGLNSKNFRQFNSLIKNKQFLNSLVLNVSSTIQLIKKKNIIQ